MQPEGPSRSWSITFPEPVSVEEVVKSMDKRRLGWLIRRHDRVRPAPSFSLFTSGLLLCGERTEIWVSGLNGSGMTCIADEEPVIRAGETVTDYPRRLRWLPDARTLSFFYLRALYLLPSETRRRTGVTRQASQ